MNKALLLGLSFLFCLGVSFAMDVSVQDNVLYAVPACSRNVNYSFNNYSTSCISHPGVGNESPYDTCTLINRPYNITQVEPWDCDDSLDYNLSVSWVDKEMTQVRVSVNEFKIQDSFKHDPSADSLINKAIPVKLADYQTRAIDSKGMLDPRASEISSFTFKNVDEKLSNSYVLESKDILGKEFHIGESSATYLVYSATQYNISNGLTQVNVVNKSYSSLLAFNSSKNDYSFIGNIDMYFTGYLGSMWWGSTPVVTNSTGYTTITFNLTDGTNWRVMNYTLQDGSPTLRIDVLNISERFNQLYWLLRSSAFPSDKLGYFGDSLTSVHAVNVNFNRTDWFTWYSPSVNMSVTYGSNKKPADSCAKTSYNLGSDIGTLIGCEFPNTTTSYYFIPLIGIDTKMNTDACDIGAANYNNCITNESGSTAQIKYDDFLDSSINSTLWGNINAGKCFESAGVLKCETSGAGIGTQQRFNITNGFHVTVRGQFINNGICENCEFGFSNGVSSNRISIFGSVGGNGVCNINNGTHGDITGNNLTDKHMNTSIHVYDFIINKTRATIQEDGVTKCSWNMAAWDGSGAMDTGLYWMYFVTLPAPTWGNITLYRVNVTMDVLPDTLDNSHSKTYWNVTQTASFPETFANLSLKPLNSISRSLTGVISDVNNKLALSDTFSWGSNIVNDFSVTPNFWACFPNSSYAWGVNAYWRVPVVNGFNYCNLSAASASPYTYNTTVTFSNSSWVQDLSKSASLSSQAVNTSITLNSWFEYALNNVNWAITPYGTGNVTSGSLNLAAVGSNSTVATAYSDWISESIGSWVQNSSYNLNLSSQGLARRVNGSSSGLSWSNVAWSVSSPDAFCDYCSGVKNFPVGSFNFNASDTGDWINASFSSLYLTDSRILQDEVSDWLCELNLTSAYNFTGINTSLAGIPELVNFTSTNAVISLNSTSVLENLTCTNNNILGETSYSLGFSQSSDRIDYVYTGVVNVSDSLFSNYSLRFLIPKSRLSFWSLKQNLNISVDNVTAALVTDDSDALTFKLDVPNDFNGVSSLGYGLHTILMSWYYVKGQTGGSGGSGGSGSSTESYCEFNPVSPVNGVNIIRPANNLSWSVDVVVRNSGSKAVTLSPAFDLNVSHYCRFTSSYSEAINPGATASWTVECSVPVEGAKGKLVFSSSNCPEGRSMDVVLTPGLPVFGYFTLWALNQWSGQTFFELGGVNVSYLLFSIVVVYPVIALLIGLLIYLAV